MVANPTEVAEHRPEARGTGVMAEGLLGGILGEEDEKTEIETLGALAGAEAFAAESAATSLKLVRSGR